MFPTLRICRLCSNSGIHESGEDLKGNYSRKNYGVKFTYVENHEDAYELSEAEGHTEFERGKGRDHSRATLPRRRIVLVWCGGDIDIDIEKLIPDDVGNAGDVDVPGGEGGGHRGLSH